MSVEELLPCPFCGGEAHLLTGVVEFVDVEVRCWICAAMGGNENDGATLDENRAAAIAAWNRRTPPAMSADHIGEATNMVAPVEAVAWRWRWPETNNWHYANYNLHPEAEEAQPLYTHPPTTRRPAR